MKTCRICHQTKQISDMRPRENLCKQCRLKVEPPNYKTKARQHALNVCDKYNITNAKHIKLVYTFIRNSYKHIRTVEGYESTIWRWFLSRGIDLNTFPELKEFLLLK